MNITPTQLKQLLLEEIVKESKSSRRRERRKSYDQFSRKKPKKPSDKSTPGADLGDDKESEEDELQETAAIAGETAEPQHVIYSAVKDMDPNDVAKIFQIVFEQLPGVELEYHDDPGKESQKRAPGAK